MDVVQSKNDNMYSSSTLIIDQPDLTRSRLDVPPTNGFIGPGVRVANNLPPEIKKIISNAFARAQKSFKYERHISCREERFFFVFSFFFPNTGNLSVSETLKPHGGLLGQSLPGIDFENLFSQTRQETSSGENQPPR